MMAGSLANVRRPNVRRPLLQAHRTKGKPHEMAPI
jgi:hypothetical protein